MRLVALGHSFRIHPKNQSGYPKYNMRYTDHRLVKDLGAALTTQDRLASLPNRLGTLFRQKAAPLVVAHRTREWHTPYRTHAPVPSGSHGRRDRHIVG